MLRFFAAPLRHITLRAAFRFTPPRFLPMLPRHDAAMLIYAARQLIGA